MKIFFSYSRTDNKSPHKLSKLRDALNISLDQTTGFENKIVMDLIDLGWGVQWKEEVDRLIKKSDILIAIITPSYFRSRMCIHEFSLAIDLQKIIYPLYYRDCPMGMISSFKTDRHEENVRLNIILKKVETFQYKDFRMYRNKELESESVQDFLDELSSSITDVV